MIRQGPILCAMLALVFPGTAAAQTPVVFTDVSVIPMDSERVLEHVVVVIRGDRIAAVGPAGQVAIPGNAIRLDGRGRFLIPGLADMHVHLFDPEELLLQVANGVTLTVDLDGYPAFLDWRTAVRSGRKVGPRLVTAGPTLDGDPPANGMFWSVTTPAQAREAVAAQQAAGYDCIKVYSNLLPEVYAAAVDEAHRRSLVVFGHIPLKVGLAGVLRERQDVIAHGEELLSALRGDTTQFAAAAHDLRAAGTWVTPNIGFDRMAAHVRNLDSVLADSNAGFLSPAAFTQWMRPNSRYADRPPAFATVVGRLQHQALLLMRTLSDSGVPLLLGTDAATIGLQGVSVHDELYQAVRAGLSPFEALVTATRGPGVFLHRAFPETPRTGVIAPDAAADLVLLDANPLLDITNAERIAGVMAAGRWYEAADLRRRLQRATASYPAIKRRVARLDSLLEVRDVPAAQVAFRQLRSAYPDVPFMAESVLLGKGLNALRAMDGRAAVAMFSMGRELYPGSLSVPYYLGRAYLAAGDTARAIAALGEAAARTPGYSRPRVALERLEEKENP